MGTEEEQDWDLQAAEYVLGTLDDQDHRVYDTLYQVDEDWQRRVNRWQARLNPLNALTQAVEPPDHILAAVLARISDESSLESSTMQTSMSDLADDTLVTYPLSAAEDDFADEVRHTSDDQPIPVSAAVTLGLLRERVRYWKFATAMAVASMVGILVLGPRYLERRIQSETVIRTVAVLQSESTGALWAVAYHTDAQASDGGTISITAVGVPQLSSDQSHQLWMVLPDDAGVRSVGLAPDTQGETVTLELPVALSDAGEFAVSLEPSGGVPGPEHGPVVTRTFILQVPE